MKIVIDIPEEVKQTFGNAKNEDLYGNYYDYNSLIGKAIRNGTPLQKGHGRLMILSENRVKENQINLDFSCQKWISEVGLSNATVTIIEADTAESEK